MVTDLILVCMMCGCNMYVIPRSVRVNVAVSIRYKPPYSLVTYRNLSSGVIAMYIVDDPTVLVLKTASFDVSITSTVEPLFEELFTP